MLNGYRVLLSADIEETKKFLAGRDMSLAVQPEGGGEQPFHAEVNIFETDDFRLAYAHTGADVCVDFSEDCGRYRMPVPLHGRMSVEFPDRTVPCSDENTIIVSPGPPHKLWMEKGGTLLFISFSNGAIRRRFSAMTGEPASEDILFEPALDLRSGAGRMVAQTVRMIVEEIDAGAVVLSDPWRLSHFEETVLSSLLLYHAHNHQDQFRPRRSTVASRDVRSVIDYIDSHLDRTVRLEDLVRISGVSQSALNKNFRAFTGMTPMAYLRRARLIATRRALLDGEAESVTQIALKYGFTHMGRFSSAYAEAFGETPSKTLSNSR